jgi:sulfur carrier protein ThiS
MKIQLTSVGLPLGDEPPERHPLAQDRGGVVSVDLPAEATVDDLLRQYGPQADQVQTVLVNGEVADGATRLKDGDAVALVGQVGGL